MFPISVSTAAARGLRPCRQPPGDAIVARSARFLILGLLATAPLAAHVTLIAPNGGEELLEGDVVTIEWVVAIAHNLENWDLWYSVAGADGPWNTITSDWPAGDPSQGSVHTFSWTVPADPSSEVRIRVRQDNAGMDYEDVSDDDLVIRSSMLFADDFESGGFSGWDVAVTP